MRALRFFRRRVVAVADNIGVVAGTAVKRIGAGAARQVVVAAQAPQGVVAGIANDDVVAVVAGTVDSAATREGQAFDEVAERIGGRRINLVAAPVVDTRVRRFFRRHIVGIVDIIGVVAVTAVHDVGAGLAVELVVAAAAPKGVGRQVTVQHVGKVVAGAIDAGRAGQGQVFDIVGQVEIDRGHDRVGAFVGMLVGRVAIAVDDIGVVAGMAAHVGFDADTGQGIGGAVALDHGLGIIDLLLNSEVRPVCRRIPADNEATIAEGGDRGVVLVTQRIIIDLGLATDPVAEEIVALEEDAVTVAILAAALPDDDVAAIRQEGDRRIALVADRRRIDQGFGAIGAATIVEDLAVDAGTVAILAVALPDHDVAARRQQAGHDGVCLVAGGRRIDQFTRSDRIAVVVIDAAVDFLAVGDRVVGLPHHGIAAACERRYRRRRLDDIVVIDAHSGTDGVSVFIEGLGIGILDMQSVRAEGRPGGGKTAGNQCRESKPVQRRPGVRQAELAADAAVVPIVHLGHGRVGGIIAADPADDISAPGQRRNGRVDLHARRCCIDQCFVAERQALAIEMLEIDAVVVAVLAIALPDGDIAAVIEIGRSRVSLGGVGIGVDLAFRARRVQARNHENVIAGVDIAAMAVVETIGKGQRADEAVIRRQGEGAVVVVGDGAVIDNEIADAQGIAGEIGVTLDQISRAHRQGPVAVDAAEQLGLRHGFGIHDHLLEDAGTIAVAGAVGPADNVTAFNGGDGGRCLVACRRVIDALGAVDGDAHAVVALGVDTGAITVLTVALPDDDIAAVGQAYDSRRRAVEGAVGDMDGRIDRFSRRVETLQPDGIQATAVFLPGYDIAAIRQGRHDRVPGVRVNGNDVRRIEDGLAGVIENLHADVVHARAKIIFVGHGKAAVHGGDGTCKDRAGRRHGRGILDDIAVGVEDLDKAVPQGPIAPCHGITAIVERREMDVVGLAIQVDLAADRSVIAVEDLVEGPGSGAVDPADNVAAIAKRRDRRRPLVARGGGIDKELAANAAAVFGIVLGKDTPAIAVLAGALPDDDVAAVAKRRHDRCHLVAGFSRVDLVLLGHDGRGDLKCGTGGSRANTAVVDGVAERQDAGISAVRRQDIGAVAIVVDRAVVGGEARDLQGVAFEVGIALQQVGRADRHGVIGGEIIEHGRGAGQVRAVFVRHIGLLEDALAAAVLAAAGGPADDKAAVAERRHGGCRLVAVGDGVDDEGGTDDGAAGVEAFGHDVLAAVAGVGLPHHDIAAVVQGGDGRGAVGRTMGDAHLAGDPVARIVEDRRVDVNAVAVVDHPGDDEAAAAQARAGDRAAGNAAVRDVHHRPNRVAGGIERRDEDGRIAKQLEEAAAGKSMERCGRRRDTGYRGRCRRPRGIERPAHRRRRPVKIVDVGVDHGAAAGQAGRGQSGEGVAGIEAEDCRSGRRAVGGEHLIGRSGAV